MYNPQATEQDYATTKYVLAMFFIFIGIVMATWTFDDGFPYALLLVDGETTNGKLISFEKKGWGKELIFSFVDQEGVSHTRSRTINPNLPVDPLAEPSLEVTYFSMSPEVAEATILLKYLEPGFWIMAVGIAVVVLCGAYTLFAVVALVRQRQKDRYY